MNKQFQKIAFILLCFCSFNIHATLITGNSVEDKLTADKLGTNFVEWNGLDWAWASPVYLPHADWPDNQLLAPSTHLNWRYATFDEMMEFRVFAYNNNAAALDLFTQKDEFGDDIVINGEVQYVQAVSYWNTMFDDLQLLSGGENVSIQNLFDGFIASDPNNASTYQSMFGNVSFWETFYVRAVSDRPPAPIDNGGNPIPEPSIILLMAIALLTLSRKKLYL